MNQCVAKTQDNHRCLRSHVDGHDLCFQHKKTYDIFMQSIMVVHQQGGALSIASPSAAVMSIILPSCLDIIKCNWTTDFTYVIPGLSLLINMFSK